VIVLSQSTHRARKEHQCGECLGTIGIGDSYERARVVDGGDAWTWKAHHLCHSVSIELTRELDLMPDDPGPDDSEIRHELRLIFEGLARLAVPA
jgi:hypothetical protein